MMQRERFEGLADDVLQAGSFVFFRHYYRCQCLRQKQIKNGTDLQTFFNEAPAFNPNSSLIKGVVCGIRVEDIEDPLMKKIRYMDKLIDELAKGKAMEKILREE